MVARREQWTPSSPLFDFMFTGYQQSFYFTKNARVELFTILKVLIMLILIYEINNFFYIKTHTVIVI